MKSIKKIISDYLEENNYEGLCNIECGCSINDLFPCGEIQEDCITAYKINCKKENSDCNENSQCFTSRKTNKCWMEN